MTALPSLAQEQYLIAARRFRERGIIGGATVVPLLCQLPGPVDLDSLNRALNKLVARHDALRCRFRYVDGRHVREPVEEPVVSWTVLDGASAEDLRKLGQQPIDDDAWPLFRAVVAPGDPAYVLLSLHHQIADAWSAEVARFELQALYQDSGVGLPPAPSFLDYCDAERAQFTNVHERRTYLDRWRRSIGDRSMLPRFPVDVPAGLPGRFSDTVVLDAAGMAAFERRCYAASATLYMGGAAAYGAALRRVTGHDDVGLQVPFANREDTRWDSAIGWFSHVNICYFTAPAAGGFAEHLAAARVGVAAMLACRDLPFPYALRFLEPVSYAGDGEPYPTCVLNLTYGADSTPAAGTDWTSLGSPPGASRSFKMLLHRTATSGLSLMTASPDHELFRSIEEELITNLRRWSAGE